MHSKYKMDSTDFAENNLLETSSRSHTPLGIKPIFEFNEDIPCLPDISQMDDFGRESLGIINLDSLDVGRESLWIANIKPTDFIGMNLPEVKMGTLTQRNSDCGVLNTAFVMSTNDSARSNLSSRDVVSPTFNLLNIPSRINSYYKSDFMNNRESSISPIIDKELNGLNHLHQMDSLSSMLEDIVNVGMQYKEKNILNKSTGKSKNNSLMITDSNDRFEDSVFIEANHLAARFEDGSIYDLDVDENDMLDSIQEPEELVNLSNDNAEPVYERETVFKMIDKILPSSNQELSMAVAFKDRKCDISLNTESEKTSKDKNPKDILSTLSELLNNDNLISEKQKSEGQNMISNLAAILISHQNQLDDSGHSSIETEAILTSPENECYEILDLRKKNKETCDKTDAIDVCVPLDLSLKSKSFSSEKNSTPKVLPPKYSTHHQQPLIVQNHDNGYLANENRLFGDIKNKFKLKRGEENSNLKKGPMRAVVPLDNMAKRKSGGLKLQTTPQKNCFQSNLRKATTPINGIVLKPVAQSTPEGAVSTASSVHKAGSIDGSGRVIKKLSYSRSSLQSINKSQELKSKKAPFIRRRSVDDMKRGQVEEKVLSRSSSVGGKGGLTSVGNNVYKSPSKSNSRLGGRSLPVLKENRSRSITRSSLGRKNGKENLC